MTITVPNAAGIPASSFATDLPLASGKSLSCAKTGSAATLALACDNFGDIKKGAHWVAFFFYLANGKATSDVAGFGKISFK